VQAPLILTARLSGAGSASRPIKTDKNDAHGIAETMRLGHYRPVHVKSPVAQSMRTTLAVRLQLVASQLQIEGTIRGLLKRDRKRWACRVSMHATGTPASRSPRYSHSDSGQASMPARSMAPDHSARHLALP
jgi:hypothetical protein